MSGFNFGSSSSSQPSSSSSPFSTHSNLSSSSFGFKSSSAFSTTTNPSSASSSSPSPYSFSLPSSSSSSSTSLFSAPTSSSSFNFGFSSNSAAPLASTAPSTAASSFFGVGSSASLLFSSATTSFGGGTVSASTTLFGGASSASTGFSNVTRMASQEEDTRKIPLKVLIDKQNNKVVAVETTKDFIDTLFSFLSLPLATIIRLITTTNNNSNGDQTSELEAESESPVLGNISNLYQSVQNLDQNDVWYPVCKQMLLHPKNPCEALCKKLFLNVDDKVTETKFFVCDSCNKFTQFSNLLCTCGKPPNRQPQNLDSEGQGNTSVEGNDGVFVKENGSIFLVFDDLKIVPSSLLTSMKLLMELGYSDWSQLETQTHNIGKQEILKLLKYTLTSHEPLTNTILGSSSKKTHNPPNKFVDAVRVKSCTSDIKMDVKLVKSKSHKKIIFAEANEDFVDFMFSLLCIPLGSIVKLFQGNSYLGCVDNLYKSVENLDSSWCTDSRSVLLNLGVAPQFSCPKQPLNIPDVGLPTYYYGTGRLETYEDYQFGYPRSREVTITGGVISKSQASIWGPKSLTSLDPRSPNRSKEGVVGFVKRPALYVVGDDLTVKSLSAGSCLFYLKELNHPLDDLEAKVISIGAAEALSLLGASLTSKFTLTSGLEDFFNVPKQESNLTSKYTYISRLNDLSKEPEPEAA